MNTINLFNVVKTDDIKLVLELRHKYNNNDIYFKKSFLFNLWSVWDAKLHELVQNNFKIKNIGNKTYVTWSY